MEQKGSRDSKSGSVEYKEPEMFLIDDGGRMDLRRNTKTIAFGITTEFIEKGYVEFRGTRLSQDLTQEAF